MIDILSDPDWPLAMGALAEASGWEVERITLAEDVWLALVDKVPMRDATSAGSPLATTLGVPVLVDRLLAPGDGYALLRNGQVHRLFGRATTSAPPVHGDLGDTPVPASDQPDHMTTLLKMVGRAPNGQTYPLLKMLTKPAHEAVGWAIAELNRRSASALPATFRYPGPDMDRVTSNPSTDADRANPPACPVDVLSSRSCERGTRGCTVGHGAGVTEESET